MSNDNNTNQRPPFQPRNESSSQPYRQPHEQNRGYNPKFQNPEIRSAGYNPPRNSNQDRPSYNNQNNQNRPYNNNSNNNRSNDYNNGPREYNDNRRPYNNYNRDNNQQNFYNQRPTKYDRFSNLAPGQEEFYGFGYDIRYFPRNFSEIKNCNDETLMGWFKFLPYSNYTDRQEQLIFAVVNECRIRYGVEI